MPQVHFIPAVEGARPEEIVRRIETGWIFVGRMTTHLEQKFIDPTKPVPPSGVMEVDVWMLPEATIPVRVVASAVYEAYKNGGDAEALGKVTTMLLGVSLDQLALQMSAISTVEIQGKVQ